MKYIKSIIFFMILVLILNLITTILYYFNITSDKLNNILKIINFLIVFFCSGFYLGRRCDKKGWIEGLKFGLVFILFSIILILILPSIKFSFSTLLYYIILLTVTVLGSMTGINYKIKKKST